MKKFVLNLYVVLLVVLPIFSFAQVWVRRYNGPGNGSDGAFGIAVDNAGNVYVTGHCEGYENQDYATVKYNSSGVEQWVARYNGQGNDWDHAIGIAVDNSGNIYVTGTSVGSGTDRDYATLKYDSSGVEQWVAMYNGPGNDEDGVAAIALDNSANVYVTGQSVGSDTNYDYATVKYNSSGVEQWVARYNGPANGVDVANAITLDNVGNVYVTGQSVDSVTDYDYATVKYNSSGVEQWVVRYNGPDNGADGAYAITLDNSGNIYVTGYSMGSGTSWDYATVKYDSSGVEQWVARYNGPGDYRDWASAIVPDITGNVYVTGQSVGSGTDYDYATVKYGSSGVELWVARYNGPGNGFDAANAIVLDNSGNVYVTGRSVGSGTDYDYATVKYDSSGVEQWVERYNGTGNDFDEANAIVLDNVGYVYVTGASMGAGTGSDCATIKYTSLNIAEERTTSVENSYLGATIFSGTLFLPNDKNCKVFDITGRVVMPDKIRPGVYFLEIDNKIVQKVVKVR